MKELEGYDLVILDVVWSGEKKPRFEIDDYFGFRGAEYLRQNFPNSKIILMTRKLFDIGHVRKLANLPDDYFKSDDHPSEILNIISKVVNNDIKRGIIAKQIDMAVQTLSEVKEHPDLLGLDRSTHSSLFGLLPLLKHQKEKQNLDSNISEIIRSLNEDAETVSQDFLELIYCLASNLSDQNPQLLEALKSISDKSTFVGVSIMVDQSKSSTTNNEGDTYHVDQAGAVGKYARSDNNVFFQSEQKKALSDAAVEIQQLLKKLEKTNPTATEYEKIDYINDETSLGLKRRVVGALKCKWRSGKSALMNSSWKINI